MDCEAVGLHPEGSGVGDEVRVPRNLPEVRTILKDHAANLEKKPRPAVAKFLLRVPPGHLIDLAEIGGFKRIVAAENFRGQVCHPDLFHGGLDLVKPGVLNPGR